jgi:hypothetical protein
MKTLTEQEKQKLIEKAVNTIEVSCKLVGINYLELSKPIRDVMIEIYQQACRDFYETNDFV